MSASEKGHTEVIRILIEAGASRSITKDKVLTIIIMYNVEVIINMLRYTHTLTCFQDEVTALHIAIHNGHVEAVEMLTHKMNKEDINARDNVRMHSIRLANYNNIIIATIIYSPLIIMTL